MLTDRISSQGDHTNGVTVVIFKLRGNVWEY